jgi:hypothetical protein
MLPGEHRRDRVLAPAEEALYFTAARSNVMHKYDDPALLAGVETILIDCALREATLLLRKQTGVKTIAFANFKLYDLCHTCLMRWAPHMDPWTLMYLAGHADMGTTNWRMLWGL